MRSRTLKWIVLSASVIIGLIIVIQLYWLNKTYAFEQKNFNINVVKAIRGLYEDLPLPAPTREAPLQKNISHPSPDYFLFYIDHYFDKDTISHLMKRELEDFDVLTDAYLAYYNPMRALYEFTSYISTAAPRYQQGKPPPLQLFPGNKPYYLLYFPHRDKYILAQMTFWLISDGILIVVIVALAVSLFFFYRQKFLAETQKDFVNNFTHEFKTPLAVMKIAAGVLPEAAITQKPERLKNYAAIIEHQTDHLKTQVDRLLAIAINEHTQSHYELKPLSLPELVEAAIRQIQPLADSRHGKIVCEWGEHLPLVQGDPVHLQMAIVNLLDNGLKYAREPRILIQTGIENGGVFLSIKDNGIGMEQKHLKRIFRKFYRIPTGNVHNVKGFGLGLNVVKNIIDAHRSKITVKSIPGIGTEFKIHFPANP